MPKSAHEIENEYIAKAVRWAAKASTEIYRAGGDPANVLEMFPDKLLATMVRNSMGVKYLGFSK